MNATIQNEFITKLTRDLAPQIAPHEMQLFHTQREAYLRNPQKVLKDRMGNAELLDNGLTEAITFLVPIIQVVLADVIQFIINEVKKTIDGEKSDQINDIIRQSFADFDSSQNEQNVDMLSLLSPAQLTQIYQLVFEKARQQKLSLIKSRLLADSVVKTLVVIPHTQG